MQWCAAALVSPHPSDDSYLLPETLYDNLDYRVLNAPDQTFEATVLYRLGERGGENFNLAVTHDISGSVPIGEQYNDISANGTWSTTTSE